MKKLIPILLIFCCDEIDEDLLTQTQEILTQAQEILEAEINGLFCGVFLCDAQNQFTQLADSTNSTFYQATNDVQLQENILKIIEHNISDSIDFVFLIDKTGSMGDDISSVREGMSQIISLLAEYVDVRLGLVFYGDKNVDGDSWFQLYDLTTNYNYISELINSVEVSGGGDLPESVYDSIVKSIDEISWTSSIARILIVIGDAPSLEGSESDNTFSDVVNKAINDSVFVNIYPILLSPF